MYGFRYHVMTLIAVFLALGLGLLLGGTLGQEALVKEQVQMLDRLENRYQQAKTENGQLSKKTTDLQAQSTQLQQVIAKMGHHYVRDRLVGKKIALLHMEPTNLSPLLNALEQAGAEVVSTVTVTNVSGLLDHQAQPEINPLLGLGDRFDPKVRQELLAEALVDELYQPSEDFRVVNLLQQGNVLTINGMVGAQPDAVILIGGATNETKSRLQHLDVPLLKALRNHGFAAIGAEQSKIAHSGVAHYGEAGVSTVDNLDQTTGLVALIDVLGGAKGHFGTKKTAEALLPQSTLAKEVSSP